MIATILSYSAGAGKRLSTRNSSLFGHNVFRGKLPSLIYLCGDVGGLAGIIGLNLDFNNLTGPLPDVFAAMPALKELRVESNNLTGELPVSLVQLGALETLRLSFNAGLSGDLADFGQLASAGSLRQLELGDNAFTGDLTAFFSSALPQLGLTRLVLYDLPAIDPIPFPDSINQSSLSDLVLDGRNFSAAPFPAALTELSTVSFLFLLSFDFTQPLPAEIANLSNLRFFYVQLGTLPGTLPPEIGNMANLRVDNNSGMSGGIPQEIGQLTELSILDLGDNGLGGEIPSSLGNLVNLGSLNLNDNQHTGTLPPSFASLTNLFELDLSDNPTLTGVVPAALVDREQQNQLTLNIDNTQLIRSGGFFSGLGGLWYDPALDGSGFNFVALADGLIATFYGYGSGGEQLWLISDLIPQPFTPGQEITDIRMLYGDAGSGRLQAPQPPASLVEWGRMSLRINSCTEAEAILNGADGQVTLDLQQLAANQGTVCNLTPAAQKARAGATARDPRTAQLLDQYRALKALRRAGGHVQPSEYARVLQELHEARTSSKTGQR